MGILRQLLHQIVEAWIQLDCREIQGAGQVAVGQLVNLRREVLVREGGFARLLREEVARTVILLSCYKSICDLPETLSCNRG